MRVTQTGGFALTRAELVALITHASSDFTRAHLYAVCFDVGRGRVVTTDGHRLALCQARELPGPRPDVKFLISLDDCKAAVRSAKQKIHTICFDLVKLPDTSKQDDVCTVEIRIVDTSIYPDPFLPDFPDALQVRMRPRVVNAQFPPIDQLLTPMPHKGTPATSFYAVNAAYLSGLETVVKAGGCNDRTGGVQLFLPPPGDELGPMFALAQGDDCDWKVLIMPMRSLDPRAEAPEEVPEPVRPKAVPKLVAIRRPA
jgi:hypothetical protein